MSFLVFPTFSSNKRWWRLRVYSFLGTRTRESRVALPLKGRLRQRAMLFCTINDFPTYGNLSGYSVKGHHACPICEEDTSNIQLKHCTKKVYTRHQRFLKPHHPYRRLKKAFKGSQEHETAPILLTSEQVFQWVQHLNTIF